MTVRIMPERVVEKAPDLPIPSPVEKKAAAASKEATKKPRKRQRLAEVCGQ